MSRWPEDEAEDLASGPGGVADITDARAESAPADARAESAPADAQAEAEPASTETRPESQPETATDIAGTVDEPPILRRPRRSARGAIIVGARVVAGTVGIGVAIVTVAAASLLPLPEHRVTAPTLEIVPLAAPAGRACPGPLLRLGGALGQDAGAVSPTGSVQIQASTDAGEVKATPLAADGRTGDGPALIAAASGAGAGSVLAGSQSQTVHDGDLAGFAVADCALPSSDTWLVGGATDTGRATLITLVNPTEIGSTVSVSVFSETGPIIAPGTEGIIVPARSQRILPLAAFAPDILSPVVRVESRGGQIVANLQEAIVRTLEPGGVSIVGPAAAPAKHTVIPGVRLVSGHEVADRRATVDFEDLATVIRVVVPGEEAVHSRITVQPDGDAKPAVPVDVTLAGGQVTDVPLDEFADGSYTITIDADGPVTAGARVSTIGAGGGLDLAWFGAAAPVRSAAQVSVAAGPGPVLHLANATKDDQTVTLARDNGGPTTLTVPAGRAIAVPVAAKSDYSLSGFDTLRIAVSYLGDGQIDGFAVSPPAAAAEAIRVHP